MTVQTSTNVANFLGNGVTTSFPIAFKFNSSADLIVEATNTVTGVTTTLSLNSDYTVTGAGDENGGTIAFTAAPLSTETVKVTRHVDLLQLTDLRNQGKFYAEVHEDVFDKLVMIDQQHQTEINDSNSKSDEAVATANSANAKSDQAIAKADQNLVDMQAQYDAFEQGAAFVVIGDYATGLVVDGYNKIFRKDGEFYRAKAELALPYPLNGDWAVDAPKFFSVGDAVLRQELESAVPGDGAVPVDISGLAGRLLAISDYLTPDQAVRAAYQNGRSIVVRRGETARLVCNPSAGDDLQAMCQWAATGHIIEETGRLYVEIADGMHDVNTYVDITGNRVLDVQASGQVDLLTIAGITISPQGGNIYAATVTVSTELPSRVVAGYAIGCQNVKGDNGSESINGAHIVQTVASNRLSFTVRYRSYGVVPTTATVIDTTTTLGLEGSRVVVPKACLRLNAAGWDGGAREGFMNAMDGSRIVLRYLGLSYSGVTSEHDILFSKGNGSQINMADRCVVAGAGDKVLRIGSAGEIYANRCCFGGGETAGEIIQGVAGSKITFNRCSMGSGSVAGWSATAGCHFFASQCVLTGFPIGLHSTYADSGIDWTNSRISHCDAPVRSTKGKINLDSNCLILRCTTPITLAGGDIYGLPSFSENTNPPVEAGRLVLGGAWYDSAKNAVLPDFRRVGRFSGALDFPSVPANSYADLTLPASGAVIGDFAIFGRSNAWPAQGLQYSAFVSASDTITVRAYNVTTSAIDPSPFTAIVLVIRGI